LNTLAWTESRKAAGPFENSERYWSKVLTEYLKRASMSKAEAKQIGQIFHCQGFDSAIAEIKRSPIEELVDQYVNNPSSAAEILLNRDNVKIGMEDTQIADVMTAAPLGIVREFYGNEESCPNCGSPRPKEGLRCEYCGDTQSPLAVYTPATNESLREADADNPDDKHCPVCGASLHRTKNGWYCSACDDLFRDGGGITSHPAADQKESLLSEICAGCEQGHCCQGQRCEDCHCPQKKAEGLDEVTPPGYEKSVKGMKKNKDISNPWALANWQRKKGIKPKESLSASLEAFMAEDIKIVDPEGDEHIDVHSKDGGWEADIKRDDEALVSAIGRLIGED
jgi:ribosomal protein L37AE/L43A